jgi:hypothetical protein
MIKMAKMAVTKQVNPYYTPHITEISSGGQHSNWPSSGISHGSYIFVGQGEGCLSSDGKPLKSEGFYTCSALIIKNTKSLESALFHLDNYRFNYKQTSVVEILVMNFLASLDLDSAEKDSLADLVSAATHYWNKRKFTGGKYNLAEREAFKSRMAELNNDGTIRACFILGDSSNRNIGYIVRKEFLDDLDIGVEKEIFISTGDSHWGTVYRPHDSTVLINLREQKKVLSYSF